MLKRTAVVWVLALATTTWAADKAPKGGKDNKPPKGFAALFDGESLKGWHGLGHTNPYDMAKWSEEERKTKLAEAEADMRQHWRAEKGEIINDGKGVFLTTDKDYRDFEMFVDWRMMTPGTDSGIYLRQSPQVQIWDPANVKEKKNGVEKGSGALWNNNGDGKWPLVRADKPVGEWNRFYIRMVGERVTVYFNDKLTVDNAPLENYWDRTKPMLSAGPIQLQTHGGEMRFRNVFVREIPAEEVNKMLQAQDDEGFTNAFNGKDFTGWRGATDAYEIKDGVFTFKPGKGGDLYIDKMFSDFAVRLEFKLPPAGNNGLAIRSPGEGNPAFVGMEIQILDDGDPKYKGLKPWQVHGSVYGIVPAARGYLRPVGEWNYEEVIAKGSHITVTVNGTKVVDADLSKVEKPLDEQEHPGMKRTEGYVGFMGHGDPVAFRNVRIKPLK